MGWFENKTLHRSASFGPQNVVATGFGSGSRYLPGLRPLTRLTKATSVVWGAKQFGFEAFYADSADSAGSTRLAMINKAIVSKPKTAVIQRMQLMRMSKRPSIP